MAKVVEAIIHNFRGIKKLSLQFNHNQNIYCFIGRGDSGKTSILEAISYALSPNWKLSFYDTDFFNCDIDNNIEILVTLIEIPKKLLLENKFGLYLKGYDLDSNKIYDDLTTEGLIPALTVRLSIDCSLEPRWEVVNEKLERFKQISGVDRRKLNCFLISDYIDQHLSWNKGSPLSALLRETEVNSMENNSKVIDALREANKKINSSDFSHLDDVMGKVKEQSKKLGLLVEDLTTSLDMKDIAIKDGRMTLHSSEVPFRLKGKGSKRLASIAIQSSLSKDGGVLLVDEIEQGLEPDRVQNLASYLKQVENNQVFLTTHSRQVILELGHKPLVFLNRDELSGQVYCNDFLSKTADDFKASVIACPEAFFARNVIVCEGKTELGLCKAMDLWRVQKGSASLAMKDTACVYGEGSSLISRVESISEVMRTSLFCDSDDEKVNDTKAQLRADIFDCDEGLCIEQQIIKDLPWNAVLEVLAYAKENNKDSFISKFKEYGDEVEDWKELERVRDEVMNVFKPKAKNGRYTCGVKWFKTFRDGLFIGDIIFKYFDTMGETAKLKSIFNDLSSWIDKG